MYKHTASFFIRFRYTTKVIFFILLRLFGQDIPPFLLILVAFSSPPSEEKYCSNISLIRCSKSSHGMTAKLGIEFVSARTFLIQQIPYFPYLIPKW